MATSSAYVPLDWVEPAHPSAIHLFDDYVLIYRYIRDKLQNDIDAAFDAVSRDIGFVVTMSLPVTLEISGETVKSAGTSADHLAGTIFDREVISKVKTMSKQKLSGLKNGIYEFPIVWVEALKYKLRLDWVEPAHFRAIDSILYQQKYAVRPDVQEPAHYLKRTDLLDPQITQAIMALSEVYPELQLNVDLQAEAAVAKRVMRPWVEPAHFNRPWLEPAHPGRDWLEPAHIAAQTAEYARMKRPDWVEPAHFRVPKEMTDIFSEMASMLKKFGY